MNLWNDLSLSFLSFFFFPPSVPSSPKSKQEVMVRPPTVMSPSGNPQLDSKFSNQGKQGGSTSQSQPSPCDPKSGGHPPKVLPGPGGSMGLKNGAGNGAKGKGKRERSISADSFEQREAGTPNDDPEIKGMFARVRPQMQAISRCPLWDGEVLGKRQQNVSLPLVL